jgi:hypothetical protein
MQGGGDGYVHFGLAGGDHFNLWKIRLPSKFGGRVTLAFGFSALPVVGQGIADFIFRPGCSIDIANYTPENAANPPSTGTTIPVTKAEAGETSHINAPSKSSGTPKRPIGVCDMI